MATPAERHERRNGARSGGERPRRCAGDPQCARLSRRREAIWTTRFTAGGIAERTGTLARTMTASVVRKAFAPDQQGEENRGEDFLSPQTSGVTQERRATSGPTG